MAGINCFVTNKIFGSSIRNAVSKLMTISKVCQLDFADESSHIDYIYWNECVSAVLFDILLLK